MSEILITGGAGFVGGNLAGFIEPSVLMDWRNPGFLFEDGEPIFEGSEFIKGDIRKTEDFEPVSDREIDSIIHLAAVPGIKRCEEEPEMAEEVNVGGTENVLEFARKNDIEKVIFASSAGVYGEIVEQPITENHPKDPLNLYSETKLRGEELFREYGENYGLSPTIMRMSNLYGPNFQVKPNLTVVPRLSCRPSSTSP